MKKFSIGLLVVLFAVAAFADDFIESKPYTVRWTTSTDTVFYVSKIGAKSDTSQPFAYQPDMSFQIDCAQAGDSGYANVKLQFSLWPLGYETDWHDSTCGTRILLWDSARVLTEAAQKITDGSVDCPVKTARIIVDKALDSAKFDYTAADSMIYGTIRAARYK